MQKKMCSFLRSTRNPVTVKLDDGDAFLIGHLAAEGQTTTDVGGCIQKFPD